MRLGILAYGSLVDEPGDEIAGAIIQTLYNGTMTPFPVEFARSSSSRAGAPTLVPVASGGARVPARIFVLHENVSNRSARDMLWRRETRREGPAPDSVLRSKPGPDTVLIEYLADFNGVRTVLYTRIAPNIEPLTPQRLAELAVKSARCAKAAAEGRDGISYLITALRNGIHTQLSAAYEQQVLRRTGAATLPEALERAKADPARPLPGCGVR